MAEKLEDEVQVVYKNPKPLFGIIKRRPKYDENGHLIYYKKKKLFKYNRVNRSFGGDLTMFAFLLIAGAFMAFPLVYAISQSLKPLHELWLFPPNLIVKNPTFKNYIDLFNIMSNSLVPMSKYLFNTIFITLVGTLLRTISASMCAYPVSKRQFRGKNFIFQIVTLSLMFAAPAATIANYIIMANLGWIDTYYAILIPALGNSTAMYLVKQFIDQFPDSVLEAARIDGAGEFRIFWQILMPSIKPAWMTLIVFAVQDFWNMGSSIFIYREELKTLGYALSQIAAAGIARAGVSTAVSIVMMIVPVITFVITQSNILETMSTSGMKD
ncbi:MAG: carbohydrate ABC transporter permease [Clostridia bacterium]|nr:carbohydrate ABC transporter permease [Clostridia bacterium]MBQ6171253.1 carbohydrate ABC transporter permease [Clostridia bacterium]